MKKCAPGSIAQGPGRDQRYPCMVLDPAQGVAQGRGSEPETGTGPALPLLNGWVVPKHSNMLKNISCKPH